MVIKIKSNLLRAQTQTQCSENVQKETQMALHNCDILHPQTLELGQEKLSKPSFLLEDVCLQDDHVSCLF